MSTAASFFSASSQSLSNADPILENFKKIRQILEDNEEALRKSPSLTAKKLLSIQTQFSLMQQKIEFYTTHVEASGINSKTTKMISQIEKELSGMQAALEALLKNSSANNQKNQPKL